MLKEVQVVQQSDVGSGERKVESGSEGLDRGMSFWSMVFRLMMQNLLQKHRIEELEEEVARLRDEMQE